MECKYRYFRTQFGDFGKMPLLEIRLTSSENYLDVDCLVDSGAVDSMFHTDFADTTIRSRWKYHAWVGRSCSVRN